MPRRIRVFPLRRLRRFLTIYEPEIWELMAAMAYASPVALFPYADMARERALASMEGSHQDFDGPPVWLTRAERRIWHELSQAVFDDSTG